MTYYKSGYLDPLHIVWRKGTNDDPYTDRVEFLKVINFIVVLSEIPSNSDGVLISGMKEVNNESIDNYYLKSNEFSVNYSNGVIQFNKDMDGRQVNISYKGRGFIQYPSERVYYNDNKNNVVITLKDIIEQSQDKIDIGLELVGKVEDAVGKVDKTIEQAKVAIDGANKATEKTEDAIDKALDAHDTTKLVFKPYVIYYSDIKYTYPNPKIGWTTQVYKTGVRYRWSGAEWVAIDLFGGQILPATQDRDGLMSSVDKQKLDSVSKYVNEKTFIFVFPNFLSEGVGMVHLRSPFKGEIVSVTSFCSINGKVEETNYMVQKSKNNMLSWVNVLDKNITIEKDSYFDTNTHKVLDSQKAIAVNDIFRIDFVSVDNMIQNLTIELRVKTID